MHLSTAAPKQVLVSSCPLYVHFLAISHHCQIWGNKGEGEREVMWKTNKDSQACCTLPSRVSGATLILVKKDLRFFLVCCFYNMCRHIWEAVASFRLEISPYTSPGSWPFQALKLHNNFISFCIYNHFGKKSALKVLSIKKPSPPTPTQWTTDC